MQQASVFPMNNLHLGDFDISQEANFDFRFFTSMSRRPFSETRDLRVGLALIIMIQQNVLSASGMLVRSFEPSLARTLTKMVRFVSQNCKINNFFVNRHFLTISHSLLHQLNCGDCAGIDSVVVTVN